MALPTPGARGTPEITPAEFKVRPAGSVDPPARLHEYGGMPPAPARVAEYEVPTVPAASDEVVIAGPAATIIVDVPLFEVSAIEVAVTVTVSAEAVGAGAV